MNKATCQTFLENPNVNPLTGRKIKMGGPTYMKLKKECHAHEEAASQEKQNSLRVKREKQETHAIFYVLGMGCGDLSAADVRDYETAFQKLSHTPVHVRCDVKHGHSIREIIKASIYIKPTKWTPFIESIYREVLQELQSGKRVLLMGFSYGGLIVCQIAKQFGKTHSYLDMLECVTFGSIYIPKEPFVDIKMTHIMHVNDIATMVNKRKQPRVPKGDIVMDARKNIVWLNTLPHVKKRWDIHNLAYTNWIIKTVKSLGIDKALA